MTAKLLEQFGAEKVAAAFIRLWREGRSAPEVLSTVCRRRPPCLRGSAASLALPSGSACPSATPAGPRRAGSFRRSATAPAFPRTGSSDPGKGDVTFVQIAAPLADRFGAKLELEPGLTMQRMEGEPSLDRPERGPRPAPRAMREDRAPREERPQREPRAKPAYTPKPPREVEDEGGAVAAEPARKPYVKREDAPRKPYAPREEGPRNPYTPSRRGTEKGLYSA